MKFFHLSDLHLGKRVNGFSMLPDQQEILDQILTATTAEQPNGVLLAGDIYDKTVPPAEAVGLFDNFLTKLTRIAPVFLISGNHDSPERLSFGGRLLAQSGVYLSPVYHGQVSPILLHDAFGPVSIYLLPFLKPVQVRQALPGVEATSYSDALAAAVREMAPDPHRRNILVTHQFVTGAHTAGSEELFLGGTEQVNAEIFAPFDYVALGHIHRPQSVTRPGIRYCGAPLAYSFGEVGEKSITVLELGEKGHLAIDTIPLSPLHAMRSLRGTYLELTARSSYAGTNQEDYLHITLTDEEDIPDALGRLRVLYPNLMKLEYDNTRTRAMLELQDLPAPERSSPLDLFSQFYRQQNGQPMTDLQQTWLAQAIETLWEDLV